MHKLQINNFDHAILSELKILLDNNLCNDVGIFMRLFQTQLPNLNKDHTLESNVVRDILTKEPRFCSNIRFMAYLLYTNYKKVTEQDIFMIPPNSQYISSLTKLQCALIICMAFFNMFSSTTYAHFNFEHFKKNDSTKLLAILNYFSILSYRWGIDDKHEHFNLEVRFCRNQGSNDIINRIKNNHTPITKGHSLDDKKIEEIPGYPQAVFANKKIGGSVLTDGSVQEEIRYLICPECLIVLLLCNNEDMTPTESVSIYGAEQCSIYSGYGRGGTNPFKIVDNNVDKTNLF